MHDYELIETIKALDEIEDIFAFQDALSHYLTDRDGVAAVDLILETFQSQEEAFRHVDVALLSVLRNKRVNRAGVRDRLALYLHRRYKPELRCDVITALADDPPIAAAPALIDIAVDPADDRRVRLAALAALGKPIASSRLDALPALAKQGDAELTVAMLTVLEKHPDLLPEGTAAFVESLAESGPSRVRCRALEVLGVLGEIDMIERLCMYAPREKEIREALWRGIQRVLDKPVDVRRLTWENFELLIRRLLNGLEYEDVEVTQRTHDDGVDVRAHRSGSGIRSGERQLIVVQCKRWESRQVSVAEVKALIVSCTRAKATEAVLITTSRFTVDAVAQVQAHPFVTLIDGRQLQGHLDRVFGAGRYRVG